MSFLALSCRLRGLSLEWKGEKEGRPATLISFAWPFRSGKRKVGIVCCLLLALFFPWARVFKISSFQRLEYSNTRIRKDSGIQRLELFRSSSTKTRAFKGSSIQRLELLKDASFQRHQHSKARSFEDSSIIKLGLSKARVLKGSCIQRFEYSKGPSPFEDSTLSKNRLFKNPSFPGLEHSKARTFKGSNIQSLGHPKDRVFKD